MEYESLKNHFLIAMPALDDPNFSKSVVFIYEHNEDGAMGLIINKPLHITLGGVLEHLDIKIKNKLVEQTQVLMGGPVGQEHGFVIHDVPDDEKPDDSESIVISASKDTLRLIASGKGPENFVVTLGYTGWDAGQLEKEIGDNDWLIAPFDLDVLFHTDISRRWQKAAELIGIDINTLSSQTGHA